MELQVNPGSSSTGYVSNVEGVLNRFLEVINMVMRDLQNDVAASLVENQSIDLSETMKEINQLEAIMNRLTNIGEEGFEPFTRIAGPTWTLNDY